jgi:hypothetical protein
MDYELKHLAKILEENQYKPKRISFKSGWNGWKLAYEDALLSYHESEGEVIRNLARVVEDKDYKLVFRGSGNVFCNYVYAFVHEKPRELPFFMLNKSELYDWYEDFLERISLDKEKKAVLFETDDKTYEFERDDGFIEEYDRDVELTFFSEDLWELIYFGYFDPNPLTLITDGWGRRALIVDKNVPRIK